MILAQTWMALCSAAGNSTAAGYQHFSSPEVRMGKYERSVLIGLLISGGCTDAPDVTNLLAEPDTLTVDLTIGAVESDGPESFGRITGTIADSAGRVLVLDGQNHDVRVFDLSGAFQFSFGGEGGGPGELSNPCCLAWSPDGDLWIRDRGNGRYSVFRVRADRADVVRTIRMVHGDTDRSAPITFRRGTEFADIGSSTPPSGSSRILSRHWRTLEGEAVEAEVIPTPTVEQLGGQLFDTGRGVQYYLYQPFGPTDITAFGPGGLLVLGMSSEYSVGVTGWERPQVLSRLDVAGPALSPAERETAVARLQVLAGRIGGSVAALPFGVPEQKPPLRGAFFDKQGQLWVELSTADGDMRMADVWGRDGRLTDQYVWPEDVTLSPHGWLGGETLLGIRRDDMGVEYVVRLSASDHHVRR